MGAEEANASLLESWQLDLRSPVDGSKPRSERTIVHYIEEIERVARWMADHDRNPDLVELTRADAVAWIADQRARGMSPSTIRSRWIAMRSLYRWATAEGVVDVNPMATIVVPKGEEPPPDVLPDDEIEALLKACQGTSFYDRRDAAVVRFFLATGSRCSEVAGLEVPDVDLPHRLAQIMGKGSKARVARFDVGTAAAIDRYKRIRGRHRYASRPGLWLSHRGQFSTKGIASMLIKRANLAGIRHLHPHMLRHTAAHRAKKNGASQENLMLLFGWSDETSLRRYGSALAAERALSAYDDFDPMAGL